MPQNACRDPSETVGAKLRLCLFKIFLPLPDQQSVTNLPPGQFPRLSHGGKVKVTAEPNVSVASCLSELVRLRFAATSSLSGHLTDKLQVLQTGSTTLHI